MRAALKTKQLVATALMAAASIALPSHAMVIGSGDVGHDDHGHDAPQSADYVLTGNSPGKWGGTGFGSGATVTWSLMPTGVNCAIPGVEPTGCSVKALDDFMPTGYLGALNAAFAAWSAVANIVFTQVEDNGVPFNAPGTTADIRIGGHVMDGANGTLAHGYFPPANGATAAGDIHFDIGETWKLGFGGPGFDIFQVAAHEIGHAIGLNHSTTPGSLMNPYYTEAFRGLQADDIAGARYIYGAANTNPVPVPGSLLLIGLGLAALGAARRRA
ncbi:matrixin family metalloprotease [Massilia sp. UBA6681]|uniref:matrixin family metalloprotease n=1 Tax=Massilia sp. UBA6681 TaxID=1946839 RepID=UPI0025C39CCF|nr:matrixin family metalloprotease [Massilia sp. UBA6681]